MYQLQCPAKLVVRHSVECRKVNDASAFSNEEVVSDTLSSSPFEFLEAILEARYIVLQ